VSSGEWRPSFHCQSAGNSSLAIDILRDQAKGEDATVVKLCCDFPCSTGTVQERYVGHFQRINGSTAIAK